MKKIKQYLGEILLLVGVFMAVYNILNFNGTRSCGFGISTIGEQCDHSVEYFYTNEVRFLTGIGATFAVSGILLMRKKKI